jgi:hypothetical protein
MKTLASITTAESSARNGARLRGPFLLREVFHQNSNVMIAALQRIRSALIRAAIYIALICQGLT